MAYRRRQLGITRASTFKEDIHYPLPDDESNSSSHSPSSPSPSLAAQAIRASAAHRNSSNLSSAYGDSVFQSSFGERPKVPSSPSPSLSLAAQAILSSAAHRNSSYLSSAYGDSVFQSSFGERPKESFTKIHGYDVFMLSFELSPQIWDSSTYENTSMKSSNESKGFWGILAEKAKSILEDDDACQQFESPSRTRPQLLNTSTGSQPYQSPESSRKVDNPRFQKGLDALTSSLNHIGDTIGNALEEGRTIVENKTSDIMHETRKLQIRRRGGSSEEQNQVSSAYNPWQQQLSVQSTQPQMQTNKQNQLKASRDVAMATAAKAKLLLRELKTVKADLTFAKEQSAQLEDENRTLREACDKGDNPADDDMIRLQLETLLAEKGRLAHENSVYARENRLLREIVEYHQLTMQDVVYLDEGIEEVTEVYPIPAVSRMLSISPPSPISPCSPPEIYQTKAQTSSSTISPAQDSTRRSNASS